MKRDKWVTVFLLLMASLLAFRFDILRLCDPVEVASQVFLNLLLLAQLLEVSTRLGLFPLLGKFTRRANPTNGCHTHTHTQSVIIQRGLGSIRPSVQLSVISNRMQYEFQPALSNRFP